MSEHEAEELLRQAQAGEIDAETLGAKLAAMVEAEASAAEAETPEAEDEEGAEAEEAQADNPVIQALGRYLEEVGQILGPDAQITPCAYCAGMGFNPVDIPRDPHSHICPDCNGYGEVTTGSKVQGNETRMCPTCKRAGYIDDAPPAVAIVGGGEAGPVQVLSDAEVAEIVRNAQAAAGVNAA